MKRIWPSDSSVRRLNVSRHSPGTRNGSTPALTSMGAMAVSSSLPMEVAGCAPGGLVAPRLFGRLAAGAEVPEELGARLQHQYVVLALEALLVRLDAAVKRVKLGIQLVGLGVYAGRL